MSGKVYITGAGCGKADMISLRALSVLEKADVVIYDRILGDGVLELIPKKCEKINVGKASGAHTVSQDGINRILLEKAGEGKIVVRLKGGDPFIFGRGGEEAEFLYENGIPFEVVPGISSSYAAAELAGIPITYRGYSSSVHIMTGHFKDDREINYNALTKAGGTFVFLMGLKNADKIQDGFLAAGLDKNTPCAVIENGGTAEERIGTTDIAHLVETAKGYISPSIIIIGKVCELHRKLYKRKPLADRHIVIARPYERSMELKRMLEEEGAGISIVPCIRIKPFDTDIQMLVKSIFEHRYIVFTSRTGVKLVMDKLLSEKYDSRIFGEKTIAVIGGGTALELRKYGINADIMPKRYYSDELAKLLVSENADNILMLRAKNGSKDMERIFGENNIDYKTLYVYESEKEEKQELPEKYDTVIFASPSEAEFFKTGMGDKIHDIKAVCIGEKTLAAARKRGFDCLVAAEQSDRGIYECIMNGGK